MRKLQFTHKVYCQIKQTLQKKQTNTDVNDGMPFQVRKVKPA